MQDFTIYCDLDGVLVDLSGRMSEIYGEKLSNHGFTDKFYDLMNKMTPVEKLEFWINLDETEDCKKLWDFIKQFDPIILTSCSGMAAACLGKKNWCSEHLGIKSERVICVQHSEDKQNYSEKNKILIDDLKSNIDEWENKGGIGILHKNAISTLKLLKSLLYTKYDTYDI